MAENGAFQQPHGVYLGNSEARHLQEGADEDAYLYLVLDSAALPVQSLPSWTRFQTFCAQRISLLRQVLLVLQNLLVPVPFVKKILFQVLSLFGLLAFTVSMLPVSSKW